MVDKKNKVKICLMSSVPCTLWGPYRGLIGDLQRHGYQVTLISSDLPELYFLHEEHNCAILPLEISRKISPFRDIISAFKLYFSLRRESPDILHAHTPKGGVLGMLCAFLAGVRRRVYTIHGLAMDTAKGFKYFMLWFSEWLSCKLAVQVLAVSPSLRQRVIDAGICPTDKICVLGQGSACGRDLNEFVSSPDAIAESKKIRAEYEIPENALVVGYIGRIVPDKGIETLVQAFEKFHEVVPESYLFLVGGFETVRDVIDCELRKKIEDHFYIRFNDEFTHNVVPFYASMDIITLPTRREGFGLTLIEAAAMELPTIASRVTGCVDAVVDGITGLLVEVDNSEQFYLAMLKLANEPDLRKKLGQQGRKRVAQLFDSKTLIQKHIELYDGLL